MKTDRSYPRFTVTPKAEAAILRGHPWVYDAEVLSMEGAPENGKLVDIVSKKGRYCKQPSQTKGLRRLNSSFSILTIASL